MPTQFEIGVLGLKHLKGSNYCRERSLCAIVIHFLKNRNQQELFKHSGKFNRQRLAALQAFLFCLLAHQYAALEA